MSNKPKEKMILVTSGFGANTNQPYVQIESEDLDKPLQISPGEARALGLNLLQAAEAAETDGFLVGFFRKLDTDRRYVAVILQEFREYRKERGQVDKGENRHVE